MLASLADAPLNDPQLVYEPKYDGIRAIVEIALKGRVRLWSRLGNDKTRQFPEIAAALEHWAHARKEPLVLDGEIVALDEHGDPAGFQRLQHGTSRTALIVFDILRDGSTEFMNRPLVERRVALERVFGRTGSPVLRISEQVTGDGRALFKEALDRGWEGLIAKRARSLYKPGKRTPDWRKLKIVHEQEFVVGGWTEPRETRACFGALLIGVSSPKSPTPAPQPLVYAGSVGTGFNDRELARVMKLLTPLESKMCPFVVAPKTSERAHWVKPRLVAQIKFMEWTADAKLRHPVYLGLRDDKKAADVNRDEKPRVKGSPLDIIAQLDALEDAHKDGVLTFPDGDTLSVTNLHKVFWPKQKLTKGDLLRYYARVAPFILPAVADRPLVMKRFPNGVAATTFYQHRAPEVPAGIRTEVVGSVEERPQIIGGSLKTLLYMAQLAAISQDPWFSRVAHPEFADYAAFDLDPPDAAPFSQVLDVARWIHDELNALGAMGVPKTSGADGLHIYIPLPAGTPYAAGMIFCQIVGALVEQKHPKAATTERSVRARGKRIYIDCLQNGLGKTLATAYSARASDYAGVSTPVTWQEIDEGFDRRDFTITTAPARFEAVGDLWAQLRKAKGVDLRKIASLKSEV